MALEPRFIWKIWGRAIRTQKTSLNKVEQEGRRASFLLKKTVFWPEHNRNTSEHSRTKVYLINMRKSYPHTTNQLQIGPIRGSASQFWKMAIRSPIFDEWRWMRGQNQNFEWKFEIVIKFRIERYTLMIGLKACVKLYKEIGVPRLRNLEFDWDFDRII